MILLIGGIGFIGMHTTRAHLDAGESVAVSWFSTQRLPDFLKDEVGRRSQQLLETGTNCMPFSVMKASGVAKVLLPAARSPFSLAQAWYFACKSADATVASGITTHQSSRN